MAFRITGRRESETGANTHYRVSGELIVTNEQGVILCKNGLLPEYHIMTVNGMEYLRDNRDSETNDNIDSQPLI